MVAYAKGTCKGERMADDEYSKIKIGSNSCSVTISLTRENYRSDDERAQLSLCVDH